MNKTAMIKEAEVAGVLAAFTDAGLMPKFASEEFDYLTEKVAENLGTDYTVDDVAYVTDALLKEAGMDKTAEEAFAEIASPAIGTAYLAKMAGEISDDQFEDFADNNVAALLD